MTFEEKAIETLKEIIDESWLISDMEKCDAIDTCEFAIDRIQKYQKIEDIYYHQSGEALENSLKAVIEDGNNAGTD